MSENLIPTETPEWEAVQTPAAQEECLEATAVLEPIQPEIPAEEESPLAAEAPAEDGPTAVLPKPFKKPLRKRVPLALRGLLQVLSFVLCLAMIVAVLATVLVADLGAVITGDGIKTLITGFLTQSAPTHRVIPAMGRFARYDDVFPGSGLALPFAADDQGNIIGLTGQDGSTIEIPGEFFFSEPAEGSIPGGTNPVTGETVYIIPVMDDAGNLTGIANANGAITELSSILGNESTPGTDIELPPDIQLPADIQLPSNFTDIDALTDWACDTISQMTGQEVPVDREDVKSFIQDSTITDFLADKVSGFADDLLSGTSNTTITSEDIMALFQENRQLLQERFQLEITDDQMQAIEEGITAAVGDGQQLTQQIQAGIQDLVKNDEPILGDLRVQDILDALAAIASRKALTSMLVACLVLAAVLLLLNFYNIPSGLGWIGAACLIVGGLLSALVAVLPDIVAILPAEAVTAGPVILSFGQIFAPIHNGVLYLGLGLCLVSLVWRIVRGVLYKKKLRAAGLA